MKLTEKQWGGYKGKYRNHKVEIHLSHTNEWKYRITKDETHIFDSEWQANTFFESKEEAKSDAIAKIDELISE